MTEMSSVILSLESVSKTFGPVSALKKIDLEINRGDVFGIVGPDSAGKTTLIRIAIGLLKPSSGRLSLLGFDSPLSARQKVGYVPQLFSLYTNLSVLENIHLYGSLYGAARLDVEKSAKRTLEKTGLWEFRDRLAGNLSGGMKQKLALSVGLIHRPEALFLDEPTTGVDPVARREFWSMLYEFNSEGVTIIVSTPYMDEVELCAKLAFLHDGSVLKQGTPEGLLAAYPHAVLDLELESRETEKLNKWLAGCDGVISATIFGTHYRIDTDDPGKTIASIKGRASLIGIEINEVRQVPPLMEDLFVSLASVSQSRETDNG